MPHLLFCCLIFAPLLVLAAPVYNPLFGGPGPTSTTDQLFVAAGNTAYESFGFEVSFNGTTDARINALTGAAPGTFQFAQASVNTPTWVSGRRYTFSESYSGDVTRLLNISVTDTVTNTTYTIPQYNVTFGNVRSLVVRMVAPDPDITPTARPTAGSLTFTDWSLTGLAIAGMPGSLAHSTSDTPGVDDVRLINYFSISGINFTQPWTLAGAFIMSWSGSTNPGSNPNPLPGANDLAFQVKAYQLNLTDAPEPAPLVLVGVGLCILGMTRRRMGPGPARRPV